MSTVEVNQVVGGGGGGAVDSVNGQTGVVVLTKSSFGLGNVNNTSDANKPVSTAQQAALDLKADLAGTANKFIAYDNAGELGEYSPMSINATNGVDLNQSVAPAATGNYIKYNNQFFQTNPSVNSDENWYADWREPRINDTGFYLGNPATGNGGLNGMGMDMTTVGNFGYMRNFDLSIQVGNGVDPIAGYSIAAINQYIQVDNNASVEFVRGFPVSIVGQAGSVIENVVGFGLNANIADCTNSFYGWQLGGNIAFSGLSTFFVGIDLNGTVTGVVDATGLNINMGGVTASGSKRAINAIGDCLFDGDVQVTGAFAFTGDLNVGSIQSFKQLNIIDGGGNPTTNNGIVSQFDGSGVVANCDMIGLSTPATINLGATFVGTSGGFGLGLASLALPNLITMAAGCSLDNLTAAAYVNLFDATNTGGTIDRVIGCRATNIPQGGTQTITRSYSFFADFFAGDVAVDSWAVYDSGAKYNWMANALKIGAGDTTLYNFEVTGQSMFDGNIGFYATVPIAQPVSSGAATATLVYTATEQAMLQEAYDCLRNLGLMS